MAGRISGGVGVYCLSSVLRWPECFVRIRFKHSNTKVPTKPPPTCHYAKAPATSIKSSRPYPRASRSTSSAKRVSGLKSSRNMAASPAISTNSSPVPPPLAQPRASPPLQRRSPAPIARCANGPTRNTEHQYPGRNPASSGHQSQRHPLRGRLVESGIATRRQAGLPRQARRRALEGSIEKLLSEKLSAGYTLASSLSTSYTFPNSCDRFVALTTASMTMP